MNTIPEETCGVTEGTHFCEFCHYLETNPNSFHHSFVSFNDSAIQNQNVEWNHATSSSDLCAGCCAGLENASVGGLSGACSCQLSNGTRNYRIITRLKGQASNSVTIATNTQYGGTHPGAPFSADPCGACCVQLEQKEPCDDCCEQLSQKGPLGVYGEQLSRKEPCDNCCEQLSQKGRGDDFGEQLSQQEPCDNCCEQLEHDTESQEEDRCKCIDDKGLASEESSRYSEDSMVGKCACHRFDPNWPPGSGEGSLKTIGSCDICCEKPSIKEICSECCGVSQEISISGHSEDEQTVEGCDACCQTLEEPEIPCDTCCIKLEELLNQGVCDCQFRTNKMYKIGAQDKTTENSNAEYYNGQNNTNFSQPSAPFDPCDCFTDENDAYQRQAPTELGYVQLHAQVYPGIIANTQTEYFYKGFDHFRNSYTYKKSMPVQVPSVQHGVPMNPNTQSVLPARKNPSICAECCRPISVAVCEAPKSVNHCCILVLLDYVESVFLF